MLAPEVILADSVDRLQILRDDPRTRTLDRLDVQILDVADMQAPGASDAARRALLQPLRERLQRESPWVYYPWSGALVRILPQALFCAVRTQRNRYKISPREQERLRDACIGIVGLSAGFSVVVNLVLESVGARFVLADPDDLSLSNTNRLQTRLADLGLNKAELAARRLWELNPFLEIDVRPEGVDADHIEDFFMFRAADGKQVAVDLVVEECDSLEIKLGVREVARSRAIPVVMDTTERGMLDVERFDHDPERPVFHGLARNLSTDLLRGRSAADAVPYVLDIVEAERMSPRFRVSLLEMKSTLTGFSQLGSDTSLGGAFAASTIRRILTGAHCPSGRYHLDVDRALASGRHHEPVPWFEICEPPVPRILPPPLHVDPPYEDLIRYLMASAARAPSGGNAQPWFLRDRGDGLLSLTVHEERARSQLDPAGHAAAVALGAAVENLTSVAATLGVQATPSHIRPLDRRVDLELFLPPHVSSAQVARADRHLVWQRATGRQLAPGSPLSESELDDLLEGIGRCDVIVQALHRPRDMIPLADVLGDLDAERFFNPVLRGEMMSEVRWRRDEAPERTGIGVWTLGLDAGEQRALTLLKDEDLIQAARSMGLRRGLGKRTRQSVESAAAVFVLNARGSGFEPAVAVGRQMQRLWLRLTERGMSAQPVTAGLYMLSRLRSEPGFYDVDQAARLRVLDDRLSAVVERVPGSPTLMLLRVVRAAPPEACSPRLGLDEMSEGPRP